MPKDLVIQGHENAEEIEDSFTSSRMLLPMFVPQAPLLSKLRSRMRGELPGRSARGHGAALCNVLVHFVLSIHQCAGFDGNLVAGVD
jgi:hypothetical protein